MSEIRKVEEVINNPRTRYAAAGTILCERIFEIGDYPRVDMGDAKYTRSTELFRTADGPDVRLVKTESRNDRSFMEIVKGKPYTFNHLWYRVDFQLGGEDIDQTRFPFFGTVGLMEHINMSPDTTEVERDNKVLFTLSSMHEAIKIGSRDLTTPYQLN